MWRSILFHVSLSVLSPDRKDVLPRIDFWESQKQNDWEFIILKGVRCVGCSGIHNFG